MRAAMTIWGDRVSPVLDCARTLLVVEMAGGEVGDRVMEFVDAGYLSGMLRIIKEYRVQVLLCGAVSQEIATVIESCDVELIPFLAGDAETILATFARGQSVTAFAMPGCRCAGGCRRSREVSALRELGNCRR